MRVWILPAHSKAAAHCAAVLISGDHVLAQRHEPMEKGQAERLMPMLAEMLAEAGLGFGDLARIGVGTGPGNFTGVRISVAAERGLALGLGVALNIDVIVPALERFLNASFLPRDIYLISRMPSEPLASDIWPVAIISLVLAFVATLYPSWRASQVNPAEALRYE